MDIPRTCRVIALGAAFYALAPSIVQGQSEMKPLNEAEMRELRIYEAKELTRRAVELGQAGRNAEAVPLAEQALERREKALPPGHADLSESVVMLGVLYQRVGRYGEAEPLLKRGLEMRDNAKPADLNKVVSSLMILGTFYESLSRFSQAEPLLKRVLALREKLEAANSPRIVESLNRLALIYEKQGRYRDAERLYKRALDLRETLTVIPLGKGPDGKTGQITLGLGYTEHADTITALAHIYAVQGRLTEAERLFRRVLDMYEKLLPAGDRRLAPSVDNLAWLYQAQGRYADAEALYVRAQKLHEQAQPADERSIATSSYNLGILYLTQGRYAKAEPLLKQALDVRQKSFSADSLTVAASLLGLAQLHLAQGQASEALPLLDSARQMLETVLPAGHARIAYVIGEQGFVHLARRDWKTAYVLFRQATELLVRQSRRGADEAAKAGDAIADDTVRGARFFGGLVTAAFHLAQDSPAGELMDAAFVAVQWAQRSAAASSLAQMAARNSKQEARLAALARERQDLVIDWEARDKELVAVSALPADQRSSDAERSLRQRLADVEARVAAIDRTLAASFPEYAALTSPGPLTIAEAQALLGANEVLIVPLHTGRSASNPGATFVWAVSKTESRWVQSPLSARELRGHITALRCGLDHAAWEVGDDGPCPALFKGVYAPGSGNPLPFDVNRSHQVYSALFGQIEPLIRGKDLLFVPSDLMGTLPLHVLVAETPRDARPTAYGDAGWLIRQHAITILPTVVSLQSLRKFATGTKATKPFIGFGNPLLLGPDGNDRSAHQHPGCSSPVVASRVTSRRILASRSSLFRDGLADVAAVRTQYPLPETADELCAVARASGAAEDSIYLGARATETAVKALSATGVLAQARIVHFATHGLLAGETQRLASSRAEPALVLTPPDKASEQDDGLLTASEVAQLRLDADWVVLSACNTASASEDGDDVEALSGLARAFFYAGARALLVSHWAVNSVSTVKLISGTFEELTANPKQGRAGALRRSMLALIAEGGGNAHPAIWAPFVVVGEGASR